MKILQRHQPCPRPECSSSDAACEYEDGHWFCFSCEKPWFPPSYGLSESYVSNDTSAYTYEFLPTRGLTARTLEVYGASTKINEEGLPIEIGFPYDETSGAFKIRSLSEKSFFSKGDLTLSPLFGMKIFSSGSAKAITVTEGEFDAMSVYQMLGSKYPVVSVRSSSSVGRDLQNKAVLDYLNSFEKIYLCLDNDAKGIEATQTLAKHFDYNKVYFVNLTKHKDANEYLQAGDEEEFRRIWWNARKYVPANIVSSFDDIEDILVEDKNKPSVSFPFPTLQKMTYGIRTGEVILFTALEGIGKTEILRAIEYHLLKETDENIAIIHLEESKSRAVKGIAGYELSVPAHLPEAGLTNEDILEAYKKAVNRDDRVFYYSHFGSDDPDVITDIIRFLVTSCNCKYVFLDHISMIVSGLATDDERRTLDMLSTKFATMTEDLDFSFIFVSHVNDDGLTRGSRNISKISHLWVHLDRNKEAETEQERNTTSLIIKKNRYGAQTGPAGKLRFDLNTFKITEKSMAEAILPPLEPQN